MATATPTPTPTPTSAQTPVTTTTATVGSEFTVAGAYRYNRSGAIRWVVSHLLRYRPFVTTFVLAAIVANIVNASIPALVGEAFTVVSGGVGARGRAACLTPRPASATSSWASDWSATPATSST